LKRGGHPRVLIVVHRFRSNLVYSCIYTLSWKRNFAVRLERETEAETILQHILTIDPEHLGAHALLTKIYTERGDTASATKHQKIWDRVRPASAGRVITERARQQHPDLNRRTNRQYILELRAVPNEARRGG